MIGWAAMKVSASFPMTLLLAVLPMHAQLPPPNADGVAMGHLHLSTTDTDASRKFWVDAMGGMPVKFGAGEVYKFPDVIVIATKKPSVSGGSEGSSVNHLGFKVKSLEAAVAKVKGAGFKLGPNPSATQQFVFTPDDVKIELTEDKTMSVPIAHHHIHFFNSAVLETQDWYAKTFGAKKGKRAKFEAADLPGVNLSFSLSDTPVVGTKGRAMDHIGFEVKDLEAFTKKMEANGVKFDVPYRKVPALGIAIAFFTDPWGTYVELTEGLNKL
jgi:catechol 2,3-dioxygenase-like lactoylglutathione lyase family enzyme